MTAALPPYATTTPNRNALTVQALIAHLLTLDGNLPVVYRCCSEYDEMTVGHIQIEDLCYPRPDGWVQDKRPDWPSQTYCVFPGH